MKEDILLIGGGGHCISCIDVIEREGKYKIVGIVDIPEKVGEKILGYPILGSDDDLPQLFNKFKNVLITVGQIKSAALRVKLFDLTKKIGYKLPVIISPFAYFSQHASIGEGSIVMHHALVNAGARIGDNCIINSKAMIEHEVRIGNHNHISTGARINGQVQIGNESFIGSGVVIVNNITLYNNVIVAAGVTVYKSSTKQGAFLK